MDKYQSHILKVAYEHYLNTKETYIEFDTHINKIHFNIEETLDALTCFSTAAGDLAHNGYIEALSENIHVENIQAPPISNLRILCFELTDRGIAYAQKNLA